MNIEYEEKPGKLGKTGIEYLDRGWNFLTGCNHWKTGVCGGGGQDFKCWAKGMTERFKDKYPHGFEPTLWPDRLLQPLSLKKPARIGVCFMGELGGEWVDPKQIVHPEDALRPNRYSAEARNWSLNTFVKRLVVDCPQHQFYFLTKNPSAWQEWGEWPDNAWVGATVNDWPSFHHNVNKLCFTKAKNKWLSLEPCPPPLGEGADKQLLGKVLIAAGISWIVIGGYSGGKKQPPIEAVRELVEIADRAEIPVWLKDNLYPLFKLPKNIALNGYRVPEWAHASFGVNKMRQELPEEGK